MRPTFSFGLIDYRNGNRWARIRGRVVMLGYVGDFRPIETCEIGSRSAANWFAVQWVTGL
jgi:hypothetical protein